MKAENSFIFLPGVGQKTEKKYWKSGYTHWDHLKDSGKLDEEKKRHVEKAEKNLEVGNSVFFKDKFPNKSLWRIYRNFSSEACFFDIETTGLSKKKNKVTTVSFYRGGESKTLVRGRDLTRENLRQEFFESKMLVSFNGKRFDAPFLEHNFDLEVETPHVDLMYPAKRIGLSGGLKKIEKELEIQRELEDIDGREAVRLWKEYEEKNDENALDRLVRYNRYDAENLQALMEILVERLEKNVYRPHIK
ncbi:MAG: ribonuclease H-like domain-containing protein [Candidatus Nanohaloarchaea archaeon]